MNAKSHLLILLSLLCLSVAGASSPERPTPASRATQLGPYEAEILIYLTPEAAAVRARGSDVRWERSLGKGSGRRGFYYFYVYDKQGSPYGSPTVGNFAVNKHTADVYLLGPNLRVTSAQLRGVQGILRAEHHLTPAVLEKYRSRRP